MAHFRHDLVSLQHDLFQRYRVLAEIVQCVFAKGPLDRLRILDIGSGASRLTQKFLGPLADITRADVDTFGEPDIVSLDPDGPLPFQAESFDLVIAMDVLEHVPNAQRSRLLKECTRVAAAGVIIGCPVADDGAGEYEAIFATAMQSIAAKDNTFLLEHVDLGLPDVAATSAALCSAGWQVSTVANSPLDNWLLFNLVDLIYSYDFGAGRDKSAFNAAINHIARPILRDGRHYRRFFVATQSAELTLRAKEYAFRAVDDAPRTADDGVYLRFGAYLPQLRLDLRAAERALHEPRIVELRSDVQAKDASLLELRTQLSSNALAAADQFGQLSARVIELFERATQIGDAHSTKSEAQAHQIGQLTASVEHYRATAAERAEQLADKQSELETLRAQNAAQQQELARLVALSIENTAPPPASLQRRMAVLKRWSTLAWGNKTALRNAARSTALRGMRRYHASARSRKLVASVRFSAPGRAVWGVMRRSHMVRRAVEGLRAGSIDTRLPLADAALPGDLAEPNVEGWQGPPVGLLPWFNPLNVQAVAALAWRPHLNLLLPGLAMKHMSGGPNTAIILAYRLAAKGVPVRFISTDAAIDRDSSAFWAHVVAISGVGRQLDNVTLVDASNRAEPLPIGENDVFMATAWWTAQMAKYAIRRTRHTRFVYLIQDYEPLLHAASTQSALAEETYGLDCIPLINSALLAEFLTVNRIGRFADPAFAARAITFAPAVDTTRFFPRAAAAGRASKHRLLFYARPSNGLRNLYELGVAALQKLVHEADFDPDSWEFLGMGEAFAPVALGRGAVLRSLPWRDFDGYAQQMRESDVLLSLMLSPHPSYPPLEMAACGKPVVTTIYANKTAEALARVSPHIIGVRPTIEDICDGLVEAVRRSKTGSVAVTKTALPVDWDESFRDALPALHHDLLSLFNPPLLEADFFPDYRHWPADRPDLMRLTQYHDRRSAYVDAEPGLLSLITPVWNTAPEFVAALAECVLNQDCGPGIEWILLDNAPTRADTISLLETLADRPGVRLIRVEQNLGIVGGLRRCLEESRHRYIVPLDADDLITPDCVRVLTSSLRAAGYPLLAYTDEDRVDGTAHLAPYCKPDWDPVLFVHSCYISHICAIDREMALALGCYTDREAEGSSDWDSFMRFFLAGHTPYHVPEVLYSWRMHPESTAGNIHSKDYIYTSQRRVIEKFVNAAGPPGAFQIGLSPLFHNAPDWRISRAEAPDIAVSTIVVCVNDTEPNAFPGHRTAVLRRASDLAELRRLVATENGRLIHLLASDVVVRGDDWAAEAVTLMELFPDIVAVGGRIVSGDGRIVEADGYFGFDGSWGSPHAGRGPGDSGYFTQLFKPHSANVVSPRHCVVRTEFLLATLDRLVGTAATFESLGAWIGAAAAEQGLRVAYTPFLFATLEAPAAGPSDVEIAAFRRAYIQRVPDPALLSPRLGLTSATAHQAVSRADRAAQETVLALLPDASYQATEEAALLARRVATRPLTQVPGIALLTLVYKGSLADQFRACAASACAQTVPFAEWIILENGPVSADLAEALGELAGDSRIRRYRSEPLGIIGGLRYCLERATADYVMPSDGDDVLAVDALEQVAVVLLDDARPTFVFSDEDILTERGLEHPLRRTRFDPVLNSADSYIWHACTFHRERALELGVYGDRGAEYCQDWDSVTRFAASGEVILHVPHVLYHWRAHARSSSNSGQLNAGSVASVRHMLEQTVARQREPGLYSVAPFPLHRGIEQLAILRRPTSPLRLALVSLDGAADRPGLPESFRDVIVEHGGIADLDAVSSAYVVFLAGDIEPLGDGGCWEAMRLWEMHEDVALIGGRIVDERNTVVRACTPAVGSWSPLGMQRTDPGPFAIALKPQTALDVPEGFFYCRTDLLRRALDGGVDRSLLATHLSELARERGLRIAYSPLIEGRIKSVAVTAVQPREF